MTYPVEPVLELKSPQGLLHQLRVDLNRWREGEECWSPGRGAPDQGDYRVAVVAEVRRLYGCPTPAALNPLIEEARAFGATPGTMVQFIAGQFRLKLMRRYSNNSN
jgi:hypothetical protein